MYRVLWIEDGALVEFQPMLGALYADGRFDLDLALDATQGLDRLTRDGPFDVVVVDIRLPPGRDQRFIELHRSSGPESSRLGLTLLKAVLANASEELKLTEIPKWIHPSRFAVLTVEDEVELGPWFMKLQPKPQFERKSVERSRRVLVDLIEKVIKRRGEAP